jgi:DHA2 family methylenomycin A resistance protein-like MFS transporter
MTDASSRAEAFRAHSEGMTQARDEPSDDPRRGVVLATMCVGYFLVLLDVTVVNVALPHIGAGLGASVGGLQWVVDAYAIALAALMLAGGTVGDIRGHKRIVLGGLGLFGLASLGCGLAPSIDALIALRAAQGIGAALMLPGTLAVITNAYPDGRERARAIGVWAGIGSAALPAGPLLGGLLTQAVSWRAVFLINVPIVIVALVVAGRTVPESSDPQAHRPDAAGVALGGGLLAVVVFAFIEGGHGGLRPPVVVAIVAAVVLAVGFVGVERSREDPMLPLELFGRPGFTAANAVAGAMNLASLGLLFVLTLYLQDVRHDPPLTAGLALFPLFIPLSVLAPLAGRLTSRVGPRLPMLAGLITAAAGTALLTLTSRTSPYLDLVPGLLLWGIGLGVLTPAVVAAAIGAVPGARSGLASAVNNVARQACGAIGIAAFGAIAGTPGGRGFLHEFHVTAIVAAGLLAAGAAVTLAFVRLHTSMRISLIQSWPVLVDRKLVIVRCPGPHSSTPCVSPG